jgi:allantoinase
MEETETLYDSDAYNDDLPYWVQVAGKPRLILPYALDTNDFKDADALRHQRRITMLWLVGKLI